MIKGEFQSKIINTEERSFLKSAFKETLKLFHITILDNR